MLWNGVYAEHVQCRLRMVLRLLASHWQAQMCKLPPFCASSDEARLTYLGPQPFCNRGVIGGTVLEGFPGQPLPVLQSFLGTAAA